ncbi:hypothetical protein A2U01_0083072, partial [Trifolium medium]|nr:hypothetical protein [Trifolium medium]
QHQFNFLLRSEIDNENAGDVIDNERTSDTVKMEQQC